MLGNEPIEVEPDRHPVDDPPFARDIPQSDRCADRPSLLAGAPAPTSTRDTSPDWIASAERAAIGYRLLELYHFTQFEERKLSLNQSPHEVERRR